LLRRSFPMLMAARALSRANRRLRDTFVPSIEKEKEKEREKERKRGRERERERERGREGGINIRADRAEMHMARCV